MTSLLIACQYESEIGESERENIENRTSNIQRPTSNYEWFSLIPDMIYSDKAVNIEFGCHSLAF